jgi:hypothetical protein
MPEQSSQSNAFLEHIIENSLFTERQLYIISKRVNNQPPIENISSGAYYRQLKQCKNKIVNIVYSIVLLRIIGALDEQSFLTLDKLSKQLTMMSGQLDSDTVDSTDINSVMFVMDKLIKSMSSVK